MATKDLAGTGPLEQTLQAMRQEASEAMPEQALRNIRSCMEAMAAREDCPQGLALGASAPDFVLSEAWGAQFWLKEALEAGPVIVVFYRGTWCPYCLVTLSAWQERVSDLRKIGTSLVAISPQYPEATGEVVKKLGLEFPVLCDPGNRVARKFGVACRQEPPMQVANEHAGAKLREVNKDGSGELPLPGTFLIGSDSVVAYRHAEVDFTKRAEPGEVVSLAKELSHGLG